MSHVWRVHWERKLLIAVWLSVARESSWRVDIVEGVCRPWRCRENGKRCVESVVGFVLQKAIGKGSGECRDYGRREAVLWCLFLCLLYIYSIEPLEKVKKRRQKEKRKEKEVSKADTHTHFSLIDDAFSLGPCSYLLS